MVKEYPSRGHTLPLAHLLVYLLQPRNCGQWLIFKDQHMPISGLIWNQRSSRDIFISGVEGAAS